MSKVTASSRRVKELDRDIKDLSDRLLDLKREKAKLVKSELTYFKLRCSYDIILSEDEIWPDDDAPVNPTPADVRKVLEAYDTPDVIIKEWSLEPDCGDNCKITVSKAAKPE